MRLWLQVIVSSTLIYGVLWSFTGPDLHDFIYPWIGHVRATGFNEPFSNYTPPYLYMLWAGTLLPVSNLAIVKAISIIGTAVLTLAVVPLLRSFDLPTEGAVFVPLLPSVIFNGPFIGQCDAWWVAACIMAVAKRDKPLEMAAWAGLGFAFKAQAVFIAPFIIAVVVQRRAWFALAIPPAIYLLAITPAWAAGWPLFNLLTVYARQEAYFDWLSAAPNLWAFAALPWKDGWFWMLWIAYAATLAAVVLYWRRFPKDPLRAALLSALIVPFFLPKMHERYFMLADILALCFSLRAGRPTMFLLVQAGSVLSLANYATHIRLLNALGSLPMAAAIAACVTRQRLRPAHPHPRRQYPATIQ